MLEMQPARAIAPRRLVPLWVVAATTLAFVAACNDGDAVRGVVSGGGAGTSAGGSVASAGAPDRAGAAGGSDHAGTGGSPELGAAGEASEAGTGGAAVSDAGAGGESEAGAGGEPGEVNHCAAGGALFVVGNYADAAGNRVLLRSAPKAATFAIIPAGVASPARPPQLFAVDRLCAPGGALIAKDASSSYRVDFRQSGSQFAVCVSAPVATLAAALALPPADASHAADTGCAGKPFGVYTVEAL